MLSDFFRVNMPYGIRGNNKNGWFAFNREYKPIGFNDKKERYVYGDYPIYTLYHGMTDAKLRKLEPVGKLVEDDEFIFWLYNDATNPMNNSGAEQTKCWNIYLNKLKVLSSLKVKRDEGGRHFGTMNKSMMEYSESRHKFLEGINKKII